MKKFWWIALAHFLFSRPQFIIRVWINVWLYFYYRKYSRSTKTLCGVNDLKQNNQAQATTSQSKLKSRETTKSVINWITLVRITEKSLGLFKLVHCMYSTRRSFGLIFISWWKLELGRGGITLRAELISPEKGWYSLQHSSWADFQSPRNTMFKFGEQNMFAHHCEHAHTQAHQTRQSEYWQSSNNAYFQIRSYVWAVNANMWVYIPTLVIATGYVRPGGAVRMSRIVVPLTSQILRSWLHPMHPSEKCVRAYTNSVSIFMCAHMSREISCQARCIHDDLQGRDNYFCLAMWAGAISWPTNKNCID